MNVLIDTNVFIWMDTDVSKLSPTAIEYFNNPHCTIWLSVASIWEVVIKADSGKLSLSTDVEQVIREIQRMNPLRIMNIEATHALAIRTLPKIHKDPFDRMMIAQAIVESAVLLTPDPKIRLYPVHSDW